MDGDWNWAVEQAKEGKKVRRIGWLPNMFMKATSSKCFGLFLQAGDKEVDLGLGDNFMHLLWNKYRSLETTIRTDNFSL